MVFRLLCCLSLALPATAFANNHALCKRILQQVNAQQGAGLLQESERRQIADVYDRQGEAAAAKLAFDLYLEKRLAHLSKADRDYILEIVHRQRYGPHDLGSHWSPANQTLYNATPERYLNSFLDYRTQVHEVEHVLQDAELLMGGLRSPSVLNSKASKFLKELGAMSAEWDMMQAIPEKARQALIVKLEADRTTDPEYRAMMLRNLRAANLPRDKYLENEWRDGRYSRFAIWSNLSPNEKAFWTTLVLGVPTVSVAALQVHLQGKAKDCLEQMDRRAIAIDSDQWKKDCRSLVDEKRAADYEKQMKKR